jgi:ABC-type transport system substrate-binding protein/tRNA A-37 threonylcarbamoyl transferase component Bud32
MVDRVGQQLGNYRLVRLLGQGGYAEVYLGQHVRFKQQAAIKVLHAHLRGQEIEHFQLEAETIATLAHPSIVRVFDFDVQDGIPFLVMDYAEGGSLRQRSPKGSLIPLPVIVSYVKQVAAALQYAHDKKFIHRDVKPENMLVGRQEEILLSDFGLAALAHGSGSLSTKEATGTLAYMAPEQIEGHPRAASDQYALGCVVYEWLCGSRPFEGSPTEVMVQQLSMSPPPLHEKGAAVPFEVEQVVLRALAKDPKARYTSVRDFATALEQASQLAYSPTALIPGEQPLPGSPAAATFATVALQDEAPLAPVASSLSPETPPEPDTPSYLAGNGALAATTPAAPFLATTPAPADVPVVTAPGRSRRRTIAGLPAALLIGLAVLVVAGGVLGSLSLLAHFGVIGARSGPPPVIPVRGGTWTDDLPPGADPSSLIPGTGECCIDQALYLPLFYGDAQGFIHPGAATAVPTLQNGGISADAKTWTFHMRPNLVWSDGQSYDAHDVDFTWKLWLNPKFGAATTQGYNLITSANVSVDNLSITFHLKQAYAPFLSLWVDGALAPLPAHHFSRMAPEDILKSPDNLNPQVVSGPFLLSEHVPGDHYTLVRNPRYYLARAGLPYLDKVVFRIADPDATLHDLQSGSIDSAWFLALEQLQAYQQIKNYTLVPDSTSADFEALYFNFHNTVLASHLEVRQAMAMAIDQQTLIQQARHGFGTPLCTDHPSAVHPGYEPNAAGCPEFNLKAANKLLDDNGWEKGVDGVRARDGQRLEFDYSTTTNIAFRDATEAILERNFMMIGIKLDIQNYTYNQFFNHLLPEGKASPPTGAVADRFDIAEWNTGFGYDPNDSWLLACDQLPPNGQNFTFYCNPALDALYRQEQATVDPDVRQQIFSQIHQFYLAKLPFIVLYSTLNLAMVRKGTHNYQPSPIANDTVNIWQWWCDHGKC